MSEERKELQSINWRHCCSFLEILRTFRIAVHPANLALCFLGVAVTFGLAVAVDKIPGIGQTNVRVEGISPAGPGSDARVGFCDNISSIVKDTLWGKWAIPFFRGKTSEDCGAFLAAPLSAARDTVKLARAYWAIRPVPWFALITTVLGLAVWALVGGAVARMAAVRIAREESLPLRRAVGFSLRKWPSLVASPLIPLGVLVLMAILTEALPGLVLMIPYGEFVVGALFFLPLLAGLVLALIAIGGTFSVGLQWPTIAAEGSDSFDAISRSISYISGRPWKYLLYTAFSAVYGCLAFVFVKFLTFLTLRLTHDAVSTFTWGAGDAQDKLYRLWEVPSLANPWPTYGYQLFGAEGAATSLFAFWVWVVLGVTIAFLVSFFFTSQTIIYFLLRRDVDATDMEEVYIEESEEEELPVEPKAETTPGAATGGEAGPA